MFLTAVVYTAIAALCRMPASGCTRTTNFGYFPLSRQDSTAVGNTPVLVEPPSRHPGSLGGRHDPRRAGQPLSQSDKPEPVAHDAWQSVEKARRALLSAREQSLDRRDGGCPPYVTSASYFNGLLAPRKATTDVRSAGRLPRLIGGSVSLIGAPWPAMPAAQRHERGA